MQWRPKYSSTSPDPGGGPVTLLTLPYPKEGETSLLNKKLQVDHLVSREDKLTALPSPEEGKKALLAKRDKLAVLPSPDEGEKPLLNKKFQVNNLVSRRDKLTALPSPEEEEEALLARRDKLAALPSPDEGEKSLLNEKPQVNNWVSRRDKLTALPSPEDEEESLLARRGRHNKGPDEKSLRIKVGKKRDLKESLLIRGPEKRSRFTMGLEEIQGENLKESLSPKELKKKEESLTARKEGEEDQSEKQSLSTKRLEQIKGKNLKESLVTKEPKKKEESLTTREDVEEDLSEEQSLSIKRPEVIQEEDLKESLGAREPKKEEGSLTTREEVEEDRPEKQSLSTKRLEKIQGKNLKESLVTTQPEEGKESLIVREDKEGDLPGSPVAMEPGEEEWDPGGDTSNRQEEEPLITREEKGEVLPERQPPFIMRLEERDMEEPLVTTQPEEEKESLIVREDKEGDLPGSPVAMEPGEEEWDPGGDTSDRLTDFSKAAFPASWLTPPSPWRRKKQGGCKRGIWSIQFYLDYRAVREGLIKGHPPSPSQHGKRVIREEDKGALSPFKSSPGSLELHFTSNHGVNRIPRRGIGMHRGRPPEQRKREMTSLQRRD